MRTPPMARFPKLTVLITAMVVGALVRSNQTAAGEGDWVQFRHDRALTGRTAPQGPYPPAGREMETVRRRARDPA